MWVYLNNAFLSIVAHRTNPEIILVRARLKGDIERVFPKAVVIESPRNDYRFHADVKRTEVSRVFADLVAGVKYDNFKHSVGEPDRHDAYVKAWEAMANLQRRRHPDPK
jgi:hypothetical protein